MNEKTGQEMHTVRSEDHTALWIIDYFMDVFLGDFLFLNNSFQLAI